MTWADSELQQLVACSITGTEFFNQDKMERTGCPGNSYSLHNVHIQFPALNFSGLTSTNIYLQDVK